MAAPKHFRLRSFLICRRHCICLLLCILFSPGVIAQVNLPGEYGQCNAGSNTKSKAARQLQLEQERGAKVARDLESHSTLVTDPIIVGYLNRVEQRIVVHSSLHGCFVVKMIKDIEPNAYSLPGGFIYVTAGLVLISSNEAELAAALAHETSHVTAQHYTRINRQRQVWGTLSLLGSPVGYLFRRSLGPLLTAKLFRTAELEADGLGVRYQNAAGYDPNEFVQLLRNAFADEQSPTSFGQRLFDTHPSLSQRTRHLNLVIRKLPRTASDSVVDTGEFHEIKSRSAVLLNLSSDDPFGIEEP